MLLRDKLHSAFSIPKFRTWLEAKHPTSIVGCAADCYSCPLASFLLSAFPGYDAWVSDKVIELRKPGHIDAIASIPTPNWAIIFVQQVDRVGHTGTPVQAFQALSALYVAERDALEPTGYWMT